MSIDSKTTNYKIQRGYLSLLIFIDQPSESALAGANPLTSNLCNLRPPLLDHCDDVLAI